MLHRSAAPNSQITKRRIHKCVSRGYTSRVPLRLKDAGMRLRVEREIRQEFVEACRDDGKTAAQVLREYMRDYIARSKAGAQRDLFSKKPESRA
jgi:hypothetical protein